MIIASTELSGIASWATILGFLFIMIAALLAPWLSSRRTEKKLGSPNGHGSSLFDLGANAATSAKAAKEAADLLNAKIDGKFALVFNRLSQQDARIGEIRSHLTKDDNISD